MAEEIHAVSCKHVTEKMTAEGRAFMRSGGGLGAGACLQCPRHTDCDCNHRGRKIAELILFHFELIFAN